MAYLSMDDLGLGWKGTQATLREPILKTMAPISNQTPLPWLGREPARLTLPILFPHQTFFA